MGMRGAERRKKLRREVFLPDTPAEDPLAQGAQHPVTEEEATVARAPGQKGPLL